MTRFYTIGMVALLAFVQSSCTSTSVTAPTERVVTPEHLAATKAGAEKFATQRDLDNKSAAELHDKSALKTENAKTPDVKSLVPDIAVAVLLRFKHELPQGDAAAVAQLKGRVERGVRQVAAMWRPEDGKPESMKEFCVQWFVGDPKGLDTLLARFAAAFEQLDGHLLEVSRAWRAWSELEIGPQIAVDELFSAFDPGAHVSEDLFTNKLAFVALLNFPVAPLDEMIEKGRSWSRVEWAQARLARRFALRPSGISQQARAAASSAAEAYISGYNLWMHHVLAPSGARLFKPGMRLITHWNLRDEIKAAYSDKDGLYRQRVIAKAMERIVTQTIPVGVIDDPRVDWDPFENTVQLAPSEETEKPTVNQGKRAVTPSASTLREPDTRYAVLLETFRAERMMDMDSPLAPTAIDRRFQLETELPEARVEKLLVQLCSAPTVTRVAKLIQQRLGRPLEPFDIWFSGFLERPAEDTLSAITKKKYPTAGDYKKDIPRLLGALGFTAAKAKYLDDLIVVDPARGAGHALGSGRRNNLLPNWGAGDFPHLRTRVTPEGMDYKGYNIAVHEMGHNVEQIFSLYGVDSTLMQGVPGTSFTEALAFTFQNRDLELLGLKKPDARSERLRVLNDFWGTWEIAGVALVDLNVWRWMYAHPDATPAQLREATLAIASGLWDRYYAPVLGGKGSPLLAIYSHMINSFLYLPNYPIGHLIAFQLEEKLKGELSGAEFERVTKLGHVLPDMWMEHATGRPVAAEPLLEAATKAADAEEKASRKP